MANNRGTSLTEKHVRCNSASSSANSRARRCSCGEKLLLLTSKSAKNPGRLFWRCALWDTQMSCNFFRWADHEELSEGNVSRRENAVEEMKRKNAKLRAKLLVERTAGRMKNFLVILSWVVTFVVFIYCALKCNCRV
ncbi:Zinc finger, GRF-type [Sesbania bispinosa]|nr:Zinc finger, GRF-type [Sesbania bispinosa]